MIKVWTPEEMDRLKVHAAEGLSSTQIAFRLNAEFRSARTRNSVIAKLDRGKGGLGTLARPATRTASAKSKPLNTKPARPAKPSAGKAGASSPHTKAPANYSFTSRPLGASAVLANVPDGHSPLQALPVVENLPAPLPVAFLDALFADRCLHFIGDPMSEDGPRMPVCGAERMQDAPRSNRYCHRHFHSQHQARAA
jgi:GcrA cell cycle regulator